MLDRLRKAGRGGGLANLTTSLTTWDPFSYKASSWFDPEWMFGIKNGFDIVIGNPPYISAVHSQGDAPMREIYRKKYKELKGAFDLYVVFLLRGLDLANNSSVFSWIIPNKFLVSDYAAGTRQKIKESGLKEVMVVSNLNVFGDTGVYPIVILGNKLSKSKPIEYEVKNLSDLNHKERLIIRKKISSKFKTVKDLGLKVGSGTTGFQAKQVKELVVESDKKSHKSMPFVVSGSVDKYRINYPNVRFLKRKYDLPFVNYKEGAIAESKWLFWTEPKIIIAGMTKEIEATYIEKPLAIGIGVYAIYTFKDFNPKYLLALLNSNYLSYFLKENFKDKHLAGGYLAINKSTIEQLPIVKSSSETQEIFAELVDKILLLTESVDYLENPRRQAKVKEYEHQIDKMIYDLYELNADDIKEVETWYARRYPKLAKFCDIKKTKDSLD